MHPMPHPVDPPERLDVDVQEIAGRRPLIPLHRRGWGDGRSIEA
jgi:hypothetical protein